MFRTHVSKKVVLFGIAGFLWCRESTSVHIHAAQESLQFEVESIKRSTVVGPSYLSVMGDRFTATNFPVGILIRNAYRLQPSQLVGGPDWLSNRYDIVAKSAVRITSDNQREMLRTLLRDRFQLKTHNELRELPIYALVLARTDGALGPSLTRFATDCGAVRAGQIPPRAPSSLRRPVCNWTGGAWYVAAGGITMAAFSEALALRVDRPVVDRTGLKDYYEFELTFSPDFTPSTPPPNVPPIDPDAPVLVTALQEQLGLKLAPSSGPVNVVVIDSIERPTEN